VSGVPEQQLHLSISPGSVILTVTIVVPYTTTGNAVKSALTGGLGTSLAAQSTAFSAAAGVTISVEASSVSGNDDSCSVGGRSYAMDSSCDDGGFGSSFSDCECGTDFSDCGTRTPNECAVIAAAKLAAMMPPSPPYVEPVATTDDADEGAPPSFPGEACYQHRSIHVSGRSPTTDLIAFSPKMWPVEMNPVTKEHRMRLAVLENGCELTHDDYSTCYEASAFNFQSAKSPTRKYELYRSKMQEAQACAKNNLLNAPKFYGQQVTFPEVTDDPKCRWKAGLKTQRFMKPVSLTDSQLVADVAAATAGCNTSVDSQFGGTMYDYAFEICHNRGSCTANSIDCVNAYTVVALSDKAKPSASTNLFRYEAVLNEITQEKREIDFMPVTNPLKASGPLPMVYATPSEGPHFPCPVDASGKQIPCDDGKSSSLAHTSPTANLTLYVTNFNIAEIPSLTFDGYTIKFSYTATWSDRFAVHPCTINLYDTGKGVGANGKLVKANEWWTPQPSVKGSMSESITKLAELRVMDTPDVAVTSACTVSTCPWPKQLLLQDEIVASATRMSGWDLSRHPFDKQILKGKVNLVANIAYAVDIPKVSINFTEGGAIDGSALDGIYGGSDWTVLSGSLKQTGPTEIEFELEIERASGSVFFKVIIPVVAVSLLSILAGTLDAYERLMIVSVSVLVGATMLDPDFLGLPSGVEGVPFLMAVVIGHMAINSILLVYSLYIQSGNFKEFWKLKFHESRTQEVVFNVYERAFKRYRELAYDKSIIGNADDEIEASKNVSAQTMAKKMTGTIKNLFGKGTKVSPPDEKEDKDESKSGEDVSDQRKLTELIWLLPILIGQNINGNLDNPCAPMGPTCAYDLDSADAQQDKDELGQRVISRIIGPAYVVVYVIIVGVYFG
jgi:hypothetical protein